MTYAAATRTAGRSWNGHCCRRRKCSSGGRLLRPAEELATGGRQPGGRRAGVGREASVPPLPNLAIEAKAAELPAALRRFIEEFPGRVLFCAESPGRREVLLELLARLKLRPEEVDGWPAFSPARHAWRSASRRWTRACCWTIRHSPWSPKARCSASASCSAGAGKKDRDGGDAVIKNSPSCAKAPVVHIDHGVGRYLGLITLEVDNQQAEFLMLQYAEDAVLRAGRQPAPDRPYTGADDALAPLHRLGSETWQKARRKAAEQVRDVAAELLDIYARRAAREGFAFMIRRPTTRPSRPASRSRRRRTSKAPSRRWSPTCSRPGPWTAWQATSASARRSGDARGVRRRIVASRWRCWCPPPSPSSTTTASATASPTGR